MSSINKTGFLWGENRCWAKRNKKYGGLSLASGLSATALGVSKNFMDEESLSYKFINLIHSAFLGLRSNLQYTIYSKKEDDDLGEDIVKRPYAANIGEIACFTEKKLNPILIPISTLLGKHFQESFHSIAHLPNALWWRSRLFAEEISVKKVIGKDLLLRLISAPKDIKVDVLTEITKNIAPLLGLIGFTFCGLFTPIKSFNKLIGNENKIINFFSDLGSTTQHIIYLFKFSLSELFNYQSTKKLENKLLATLGLSANTLNILMPFINIFDFKNSYLDKTQKIYNELASGSSMAFFSTRRHLMGKEWLTSHSNNTLSSLSL